MSFLVTAADSFFGIEVAIKTHSFLGHKTRMSTSSTVFESKPGRRA